MTDGPSLIENNEIPQKQNPYDRLQKRLDSKWDIGGMEAMNFLREIVTWEIGKPTGIGHTITTKDDFYTALYRVKEAGNTQAVAEITQAALQKNLDPDGFDVEWQAAYLADANQSAYEILEHPEPEETALIQKLTLPKDEYHSRYQGLDHLAKTIRSEENREVLNTSRNLTYN